MIKKRLVLFFVIFILIIVGIYFLKNMRFDINRSPSEYKLDMAENKGKYVEHIKKYIKPEKLCNFLNIEHIDFFYIEEYNTGNDALEWFKYEAYTELFYQMFDKNRNGYDDCPVTENFKNKFGRNLFEYFKFNNIEDSAIDCGISDKEKTLRVTEAGDFTVGEPGYIYYHHFHYTLDDEGNIDDIIFDYKEP